jgi:hypothetical protein
MKTILGTGINIRGGKQQEIYMNDADRSGHFWCFGTTRVGKTRLLENMLEQDIQKGNSVVVIDPKGDKWKDNPHAMTEIRNDFVHPEKKYSDITGMLIFDVWNLGLRYLEMSLSSIFGYKGTYQNRLNLPISNGDVEKVPWMKDEI